jgi:hypothetical protein
VVVVVAAAAAAAVAVVYIYIDLCLFLFVYIIMNSSLNGNCGSCPYFTWYLQNACCTDFQTQRFLNDCLIVVGTIIDCNILHTNAVALCLHFTTPTCSCD